MLLPWVVGVQLSAEINGSLVLLAFEADSLLYSVIALSPHLSFIAFVCVYHWKLYTFVPLCCLVDRHREAALEREG